MLACSLILSRINYCNAVLCSAPSDTIHKLQRVQNNATRIVHQAPRQSCSHPLLKELHWLLVEQRISYKLAILTFKIQHTSAPAYVSRHIRAHSGTRTLQSLAVLFLDVPAKCKRSFSCAAPATWNSASCCHQLWHSVYIYLGLKLTCSILLIASLPVLPSPQAVALWCSTNVWLLSSSSLLLLSGNGAPIL